MHSNLYLYFFASLISKTKKWSFIEKYLKFDLLFEFVKRLTSLHLSLHFSDNDVVLLENIELCRVEKTHFEYS